MSYKRRQHESNGHCPAGGAHYWRIGIANGETSLGICKYCQARKEFRNSATVEDIVSATGFGQTDNMAIAKQAKAERAELIYEKIIELAKSGATLDEIIGATGRKATLIRKIIREAKEAAR